MAFLDFVLDQLPPAPARVLEIGCGDRGGVTPALAERGYDALGVDPRAPAGPRFRQEPFETFEPDGAYDAVVAGRVLHHIDDLGAALDRLARVAPLILVDEFAWDRFDAATADWYEGQRRMLEVAGHEPQGPPTLEEWRWRHPGLHPYPVVREALDAHYAERAFEWLPYLHRWLGGPSTEGLETSLIDAGAIQPLGYRYAGVRR